MRTVRNSLVAIAALLALFAPPASAQSTCTGGTCPAGCVDWSILNVTDFGAAPNDSEDDAPEIQCALDCAAAQPRVCGSSTVFIPAGIYYVSQLWPAGPGAALKIGSGVTLLGEGPGISILRPHSDATGGVILANVNWAVVPTSSNTSIHICDITFDGKNYGSYPAKNVMGPVNFAMVQDFSFTRCEFLNSPGTSVVTQQGSARGVFQDCVARDNGSIGFYAQSRKDQTPEDTHPPEDLVYVGCVARNNGGNGFGVSDGDRVTFVGCVSEGNGTQGFAVDGSRDVSYVDCIARDNLWFGFGVWYTSNWSGARPQHTTYTACIAEANGLLGWAAYRHSGLTLVACQALGNGWDARNPPPQIPPNGVNRSPEDWGHGVFVSGVDTASDSRMERYSIVGGTVADNFGHGIYSKSSFYGTIAGVVIKNNSQGGGGVLPTWACLQCNNDQEVWGCQFWAHPCDGVRLERFQGLPPDYKVAITRRVLISGCEITDDQATKTQNYAIYAKDGECEASHAFFNNVRGNVVSGQDCPADPYDCPIQLPLDGEHADNPGNEDWCS